MKINETQRIGAVNSYKKSDDPRLEHGTCRKRKLKDEVRISPEAKQLLGIQGSNTSDPAQSAARRRLEELKQSVSAGTYHVDARKIAEKLFPYIKN